MSTVRLPRTTVEHLSSTLGVPLPWHGPGPTAVPLEALGPPPSGSAVSAPAVDPDAQLRGAGLLDDTGRPHAEVRRALHVLAAPQATVDVDVAVRRAPGGARVHSWQRVAGDRVTSLSTAGSVVELAWHGTQLWQHELARAVTVAPEPARSMGGCEQGPAPDLELPHELLLAGGAALRLGREDVLAELLRRHPGTDPEQVRSLHAAARGRMRAVVCGVGSGGTRRIGWISWLLLGDGWHALRPVVADGVPMVRVQPVEPLRLGVEVARLLSAARA